MTTTTRIDPGPEQGPECGCHPLNQECEPLVIGGHETGYLHDGKFTNTQVQAMDYAERDDA